MNVLERDFFTDADVLQDPAPYYVALRERGTVWREPHKGVFMLSGVEDLADRPDCARREHHRAEDGLLGVEVLGRDRGVLRRRSEYGHVGISGGWKRRFQRVDNRLSHRLGSS